jgi:hypothetical protein
VIGGAIIGRARASWHNAALVIFGAALLSACLARPRTTLPAIDSRDVEVYRVVAESLYLGKANGRPIAIVNRTLDTACERVACTPLTKR